MTTSNSSDWTCGCNTNFSLYDQHDANGHLNTCHLFVDGVNFENVEVIASSQDTDILANLLEEKKEDLLSTFGSWIVKLADNEASRKKTLDCTDKIKESLSRQLQDGLLNYYEYIDLEYIGRVWTRLLTTLHTYKLGSSCNKKDIVSLLLELFELKQISKELLIKSLLEL